MKKCEPNKKALKKIIALSALAVLFAVLRLLTESQKVCEFFSTTVSRWWITAFGTVFGWLPFSVYELCLVLAVLGAVTFVVFVIAFAAKRHWRRLASLVLAVAIGVMSFLNVYTLSASFAYNRNPLPSTIYAEYSSDDFDYQDAVALAELLVDAANEAYLQTEHDEDGNIVYPYTFDEISDLIAQEYARLTDSYFSSYTPHPKKIVNKWIMSQLHITGVFFAPFGEANINGNENNLYLPVTMAHEMAHAKGVMREYQADLVAYYVLLTSNNPYLRYGALAQMATVALNMVYLYPDSSADYAALKASLNNGIAVEKTNYTDFYAQFTLLEDVGDFFNDIYLKFQKQQDGTDSYVKPGQTQDTGTKDDDGKPIVKIISFSGKQNLLINMYKQGLL